MPFVRRKYRKKRSTRFVRRHFKKHLFRRVPRSVTNGVHYFKRSITMDEEQIAAGGATNLVAVSSAGANVTFGSGLINLWSAAGAVGAVQYWSFGYKFNLSNLPSLSDFSNLFDSFKIRKIVVKAYPYATNAASATGGVNWCPVIHWAIDHDSWANATPSEAGIDELQQYSSYKRRLLLGAKPFTAVIKPRYQISSEVQGPVTTPSIQGPRNLWLDMAVPQVDHYGLLFLIEAVNPSNVSTNFPVRFETTYYLSFKGVR